MYGMGCLPLPQMPSLLCAEVPGQAADASLTADSTSSEEHARARLQALSSPST